MIAHIVLVAMAPWLHAHSAEPIARDAGFHLFVATEDNRVGLCPNSGEQKPVLTADISEKRALDEAVTTTPPSPATQSIVLVDCQQNMPANSWPLVDDWSFGDTVPPLSALPQAP